MMHWSNSPGRVSSPEFSPTEIAIHERRQRGFTLIEVLIVMVIVAVMVATVVVGYRGGDREQTLKVEARRLGQLIEYVRQQAVLRNEEWGIYLDDEGYRFVSYDIDARQWVPEQDRPLGEFVLERMRLELFVDDELALPDVEENATTPEVVFFSSGETQAFNMRLVPEWQSQPWLIESDGLSRVTVERQGS